MKKGLAKESAVLKEEVKALIEKYKFMFKFETSAKLNLNITAVFEELARNLIYNSIERRRSANPIPEKEWSLILRKDR